MNGLQHSGAFVVQFQADANFEAGLVEGRVEHVASGLTAHFQSTQELLDAFARLLRTACPTEDRRSGAPDHTDGERR